MKPKPRGFRVTRSRITTCKRKFVRTISLCPELLTVPAACPKHYVPHPEPRHTWRSTPSASLQHQPGQNRPSAWVTSGPTATPQALVTHLLWCPKTGPLGRACPRASCGTNSTNRPSISSINLESRANGIPHAPRARRLLLRSHFANGSDTGSRAKFLNVHSERYGPEYRLMLPLPDNYSGLSTLATIQSQSSDVRVARLPSSACCIGTRGPTAQPVIMYNVINAA